MLHAPPAIVLLDPPEPHVVAHVVAFAVDLVVDRGDAPRVAVRSPRPGQVDVVNVEDAGHDPAGRRRVRFLVEAEREPADDYEVRVIVSLGDVEQSLPGPRIPARA